MRTFLLLLLLPSIVSATKIRCYKGLKYFVGQEQFQDTEDCDAFLGMGEAYCYKFSEETTVNEVTKMGCSSVICNAFRNTCQDAEAFGMKGRLCCCNDRHYCNGKARILPYAIPFLLFFTVSFEVILFHS